MILRFLNWLAGYFGYELIKSESVPSWVQETINHFEQFYNNPPNGFYYSHHVTLDEGMLYAEVEYLREESEAQLAIPNDLQKMVDQFFTPSEDLKAGTNVITYDFSGKDIRRKVVRAPFIDVVA